MKAFVLREPGGIENLELREVALPEPATGEVRIAVEALSINPVDVKIKHSAEGLAGLVGASSDVILGWDVAGRVDAVGSDVEGVAIGDPVFGMVNFPGLGQAYAEQVVAPADQLAVVPAGIEMTAAAAATLAALTALQALQGRVRAGDEVLIHGGSGGVGHVAVQVATAMGARVTATSSGRNREFVLGLGADRHIDYREQAVEDVLSGLDLVLDTVGPAVAEPSLGVLRPGGTLVSIALGEAEEQVRATAEAAGVSVETLLVHADGAGMRRIAEMLADGSLVPAVGATFPFAQLPAAHTEVESGRSIGKVVVTM